MARNRSWWSKGSEWRTNSNPAWLKIEVDNLMEVDEMTGHYLGEEIDLMEVNEVVNHHLKGFWM